MKYSEPDNQPRPTVASPALCGGGGGTLAGLVIAALTLQLNPHLLESLSDRAVVLMNLAVLFGLTGLLAGALASICLLLVRRWFYYSHIRKLVTAALLAVPLLYVALLPDLGLTRSLLSRLLFEPGRLVGLLALLLLVVVGAALGLVVQSALTYIGKRLQRSRGQVAVAAWLVCVLVTACLASLWPAPGSATLNEAAEQPSSFAPLATGQRSPAMLLCVDGASLDVILELTDAGELPVFSRLMREGVWGPLATIRPTLSPIVWTTIATGKSPEMHGIRGFVTHSLPGLKRSIDRFPKHTGLTYHIFPLLESIPGAFYQRSVVTSNLRTARPVWSIIGEHLPVGVYHWLVTWPAESVNGFLAASHVYAGMRGWQLGSSRQQPRQPDRLTYYPADLFADLEPPHFEPAGKRALARFARTGEAIDRNDRRSWTVVNALRDPTVAELPQLMSRYQPVFTAAAFYSVDAFQHRFGHDHRHGGRWQNAVNESYRLTDARLGQLLREVPEDTNLIVVSDHGYDFVRNHHDDAPPGVFLAHGPAFVRGRRVAGLSVYDIAPLCLDLLGLPTADDMPGAVAGSYRQVLTTALRKQVVQRARIASYERDVSSEHVPVSSPDNQEIKDQLKSLGYLQ
jgi:hypothetical protein